MDYDKYCKNLAVFAGGVLFGSAGVRRRRQQWKIPLTKPDPYDRGTALRPPVSTFGGQYEVYHQA